MNAITLRDACEADLPAMLDIYNEVIINTTAVFSEQPHSLQMRKDWYLERVKENFPVLIAEDAGEIQVSAAPVISGPGRVIVILLNCLFTWKIHTGGRVSVSSCCKH